MNEDRQRAERIAHKLEYSTEREIHTTVEECQFAAACIRAVLAGADEENWYIRGYANSGEHSFSGHDGTGPEFFQNALRIK